MISEIIIIQNLFPFKLLTIKSSQKTCYIEDYYGNLHTSVILPVLIGFNSIQKSPLYIQVN